MLKLSLALCWCWIVLADLCTEGPVHTCSPYSRDAQAPHRAEEADRRIPRRTKAQNAAAET